METSCKQHFKMDAFHKHKWNACKVVREQVRNDPRVILAFNRLMSSTLLKTDGASSDLKESIRTRVMKRYLNMRCKEFVKVVKRELNYEKVKEHRKKVQEKANKGNNNTKNLISQLCNDTSERKNVSFYTLKAMAATDKDSFMKMTKKEIHLLFHLFGLTFKKSMNKTKLCEKLTASVNNAHEMTNPSSCTINELGKIQDNKKCMKCSSTTEVVRTLPNEGNIPPSAQSCNSQDQHARSRCRRKQFRATNEQKRILEEDHGNGVTPEIINQRALEFDVHASQIASWHKRFRLKKSASQ